MKKFLILFIVLLSAAYFAQTPNWTEVKETNIDVSSVYWYHEGVDIYTNRYGNHIILQEVANLKYYRMNVNGVASSPITIEESYVVSPSISGDADNIYIVYGIGSQVRVQRSTNGGTDWSLWSSFTLSTSTSDMESVFSNDNLHVTYLESDVVKYRYRISSGGPWNGPFTVSTGETGIFPRIAARYIGENNDYVYFVWKKQGTHLVNWRRFEVTNPTLGDKKYGYEVNELNLSSSRPMGFNVTSSTIIFYYYYEVDEPEEESTTRKFRWLYKDLDNNYLSTSAPDEPHWHTNKIYSTTTSDNKNHVVYYLKEGGEKTFDIWRSNSINGYWDDNVYDYDDNSISPFWEDGPRYINNSSAGNEVHVIWKDAYGNNGGNNLRYKYDDQTPITPPNFAGTIYNNHPKLTWDKIEPDIAYFEIWQQFIYDVKNPGNWNLYYTTQNTSFIDYGIQLGGTPIGWVNYRVRSKDVGGNYSPYTGVGFEFGGGINKTAVEHQSFEYSLSSNYPNPFNPSTQISYSLAKDAFVTLKVYDMLGNEVAELVNRGQTAGVHEISFDASELSSGIYIYRVTAMNGERILFSQSKRMVLMK